MISASPRKYTADWWARPLIGLGRVLIMLCNLKQVVFKGAVLIDFFLLTLFHLSIELGLRHLKMLNQSKASLIPEISLARTDRY